MSSRRTSRCASAQLGKWTCASLKPGSTQRPPRFTRSGVASAVSCVPTPPATRLPAIASARTTGIVGSSVRIVPFSRITTARMAAVIDHVTLNVADVDAAKAFYEAALKPVGYELAMDFVGGAGFAADGKPDFFLAERGEPSTPGPRRVQSRRPPDRRRLPRSRARRGRSRQRPAGHPARLPRVLLRRVRPRSGRQQRGSRHARPRVIDHVTLRVSDFHASKAFYETVLVPLGYAEPWSDEEQRAADWGDLSISQDDQPLSENVHIAFAARNRAEVEEFHRVATRGGLSRQRASGRAPLPQGLLRLVRSRSGRQQRRSRVPRSVSRRARARSINSARWATTP